MPPAVAVAAAVVGAGATVYSAVNAKKASDRAEAAQAAAFLKQKTDAQIARQNAQATSKLKTTIGADLSFGTGKSDAVLRRGNKATGGTQTQGTGGVTAPAVGGL